MFGGFRSSNGTIRAMEPPMEPVLEQAPSALEGVPAGVITAMIGGPFFVVLLRRKRQG